MMSNKLFCVDKKKMGLELKKINTYNLLIIS